ncbi:hypothetical protein [Halorussus amylolyticus]|uniref:hypothetical protein n=1 Tax=Halorussus amylolyticus TaxID=1126242 RepID=UPI001049ADB0|nr:hypothetical protein [Halorussus amylolyticus]
MRREPRGRISRERLNTVERTFQKRLNGLVKSVEWHPDYDVGLEDLRIELRDGIHAAESRFDVAWWTQHGYKYHYTEGNENGLQFRFGWEIRPEFPDKHFHPPDDLHAHRESCIRHEDVKRVTLAVIKCWYAAAKAGDPEKLNALSNPP